MGYSCVGSQPTFTLAHFKPTTRPTRALPSVHYQLTGVFYTITCPSRMHARLSASGKQNPKYDETITPSHAQAYLAKLWTQIRAKLARKGIHLYGFRVAEPQHDGTPQWHMLFFMPKEHLRQVGSIIKEYAMREDSDEPGAAKHRYKEERIDRSKGTAASAMDLAYLTGQRPADTLKMRETDIRDSMLVVKQGKSEKDGQAEKIVRVRLKDDAGALNELGLLIEEFLKRKRGQAVRNLALVISKGGYAFTASGLDNGFERARIKAAAAAEKAGQADLAARIRGFQFRDLRAKAGTEKADSDGLMEAQRQLGHSSVTMTEHYVRLGQIVTPTK